MIENHEERIQRLEEEIVNLKEVIQAMVSLSNLDSEPIQAYEISRSLSEWAGNDPKEKFDTTCRRCGKPITWFDFDKMWWHENEGSNGEFCDNSRKRKAFPA